MGKVDPTLPGVQQQGPRQGNSNENGESSTDDKDLPGLDQQGLPGLNGAGSHSANNHSNSAQDDHLVLGPDTTQIGTGFVPICSAVPGDFPNAEILAAFDLSARHFMVHQCKSGFAATPGAKLICDS